MSLLRLLVLLPLYVASYGAAQWTGVVLVFTADVLSNIVTRCDQVARLRAGRGEGWHG